MNRLIITFFAIMAVTAAVPSGWGIGGLGLLGGPVIGPLAPVVGPIAAPVIAPIGATAITNGGGVVGVSGAGAVVRGPPTAPVLIEGPPGTGAISARGLWGPTLRGVVH